MPATAPLLAFCLAAAPREDIVIADFEGSDYGDWRTTGTAFGTGPARGTRPDQMAVEGFEGRGIAFPGMPFNQQMTVPCTLTLRDTPDGPRMHAEPVEQLARLRGMKKSSTDRTVAPGEMLFDDVRGDRFEIQADIAPGATGAFGFDVRGVPVDYDAETHMLSCKGKSAPLVPADGRVRLRIPVDRGSIEVFGNGGRMALSVGITPADGRRELACFARGPTMRVHTLDVWTLKSAWDDR